MTRKKAPADEAAEAIGDEFQIAYCSVSRPVPLLPSTKMRVCPPVTTVLLPLEPDARTVKRTIP